MKKLIKKLKQLCCPLDRRMCDMDKIVFLAKKYNLKIIEDAAQAMGSYYKNSHAGTFSDVAVFSCHPLKNLNAIGDSGFITTNNKKIYERINLFKNHGLIGRDKVEIFGVNSRMDSINSSILIYRLGKLKNLIKQKKKI